MPYLETTLRSLPLIRSAAKRAMAYGYFNPHLYTPTAEQRGFAAALQMIVEQWLCREAA